MKISVVKEVKKGESRVGMTPENAKKLVDAGHTVLVEENAGANAGFPNEDYIKAGAKMVSTDEAWNSDMVVKVKEPQEQEFKFFKENQIIWGFLHLAPSPACVDALIKAKSTAMAGETISKDGALILLKPMSAIAGRRAIFMGGYYLEKQHGGEGILLSEVEGIPGGNIVILGGGNAAENSADMGVGMGCSVTILELNPDRQAYLKKRYEGKNVRVLPSTTETLEEEIQKADLFISTILIPGARPPKIVKEYMVKTMKKGSVIVDISIDQGGTVETIDKYTTHESPIFEKHGVIHYAVPNMPGATPKTSTLALAKGNIDYLLAIANKGLEKALADDASLLSGLNIYKGEITYKNLADTLNKPFKEVKF